jgi:hypothetical protein
LAKAREFWSFRVPQKSDPPTVSDKAWPRGEIDQFLLATMEARSLRPVQDASRRRLLRRVTFDLIGLPPTPDDMDAFLRDENPGAYERVVDRLLSSQQFGEHWGRHWLDVARYAESSGKTNFTYPQAWRYRDWVIASLNADKPYDQFVREHETQRAEQLIGTGFLAIGSKSHESENPAQFALDVIDEQIEATTRAFLGLTVACARCHDHKLDPITQKDYYALSGILRSSQTCSGTLAGVFPNFNSSPLIELPAAANVPSANPQLTPEQRSGMERRLAALREERDAIPPGDANRDQVRRNNTLRSTLQHRLMMDRIGETPRAFCMGIRERHEAVDSRLYVRGELEQPGPIVPRALPAVFTSDQTLPIPAGSGRLELANWLTARSNPLTARVMVNRIWLHLFGRGIVSTPDNFGTAGAPPGHPELLDLLAVDFMTDGWSIKHLIRRIVLSRAYGLDSSHDDRNFEADPDNELVWRMSKRRLNAEVLRDSLLFAGGNLELRPPVGSAVARVGEGLAVFVRIDGIDVADLHRSVYLPIIREQVQESLTLFDFADPSLVSGERSSSTSPTQAFYFMNNALVIRQADALADRILKVDGDDEARIATAYELVFSRDATSTEQQQTARFLREFRSESSDIHTIHKSWSAFCQALFASGEFRYLD